MPGADAFDISKFQISLVTSNRRIAQLVEHLTVVVQRHQSVASSILAVPSSFLVLKTRCCIFLGSSIFLVFFFAFWRELFRGGAMVA